MKRWVRVDFVHFQTREKIESVQFDEDQVNPGEWIRYALKKRSSNITVLHHVHESIIHPNDVEWKHDENMNIIFTLGCLDV